MKKKLIITTLLLWGSFCVTMAQNKFDIIFPNSIEKKQRCQHFTQMFREKPKEVKFGIKREGSKLYFETNNKKWFTKLFKASGDGISVDIVPKTRYACNEEVVNTQIRGLLLKPVYAKQLRRGLKPFKNNLFRTYIGQIPEALLRDDLEFNICFLNNKNLYDYYTIYNLESYPWELLDMGVYLDSITYKSKKISSSKNKFVKKYKTLKFTIPFEKNKANYIAEDIKPLYDSLRLTDFNIKKIHIQAYASVEGSLKRNMELQEQRASSIATALQSFQKPNIITDINSSENWVEFLNDVENTPYTNLTDLSKAKIKSKLVGTTAKELEPYLKNHRKAVVTLELDKIDKYKEMSITKLTSLFNEHIVTNKLEEALHVQNSLLEKVKEKNKLDLLKGMEIPRQQKYLPFMIKNSMLKYLLDIRQTLIVTNELERLEELDAKNKRIKYNLAVLQFIIWRNNAKPVNEKEFKTEILNLKKYGIAQSLIDRMLVNFHIVKAEKEIRKGNYKSKDASVKFILNNYKNFRLSNYDYLSLAQFLTYYSNMDAAVEILDKKARKITIDEDLLFYYINLTIINRDLTETSEYRAIMLNAINMNKERFCKLFNPSLEGGVTFQLLEDAYLQKTYCENCIIKE